VIPPGAPRDVSVVVPLLNEAGTLRELVDRITAVLSRRGVTFEIVLVDDGSEDGTAAVLAELEREHEGIRAFAFTRNFGQSAAIACGLADSRGRVVVTMDGPRRSTS
jgi:glycosyltransferase involved in cell wall biosynthesis